MHEDPELVPSDSENESEDWSDEEGPGCSQGQTPDALPSQEIASALIKGHLRMESDAEAQSPAPVGVGVGEEVGSVDRFPRASKTNVPVTKPRPASHRNVASASDKCDHPISALIDRTGLG